jgi:hypothetical protein
LFNVCNYWDEKVSRNLEIIASYSVLGLWLKLCNALAGIWLWSAIHVHVHLITESMTRRIKSVFETEGFWTSY